MFNVEERTLALFFEYRLHAHPDFDFAHVRFREKMRYRRVGTVELYERAGVGYGLLRARVGIDESETEDSMLDKKAGEIIWERESKSWIFKNPLE